MLLARSCQTVLSNLPASHRLLARSARATARASAFRTSTRTYALSRFPERGPGSSRKRDRPDIVEPRPRPEAETPFNGNGFAYEEQPSTEQSPLWQASQRPPASDPEAGLRRLLLGNDLLVVTRQLEMLNLFIGFEQSNRYVISDPDGETLGYIAEEPRGFFAMFQRQMFRTHRPFRALVMDSAGTPILWLRRPFDFINSRMYVQRLKDYHEYTPDGEPILDTFGEVQQQWHLWRRRYDLFLREQPRRILSTAAESQPEPDSDLFHQFARIDGGFLEWDFVFRDARGEEIASVKRTFRGFGRELFTDTGQYFIRFGATPPDPLDPTPRAPTIVRDLTLEERCLVLAMSVNIDFDYFSHHSKGHGTGLWFFGSSIGE